MPDTAQTRSALTTALADNTSGLITPQVIRNLLASIPVLGAWSSSVTYGINDIVLEGGTYYIATAISTNNAPPNNTYWTPLANGYLPLSGGAMTGNLDLGNHYITNCSSISFGDGGTIGTDGSAGVVIQDSGNNVSLTVDSTEGGIITSGGNNLDNGNGDMNCQGTLYVGDFLGGSYLVGDGTSIGTSYNTLDNGYGEMSIQNNIYCFGAFYLNNCSIGENAGEMQFLAPSDSYPALVLSSGRGVNTAANTLDDGSGNMTVNGSLTLGSTSTIHGNGSNLTYLNASNIASGTLSNTHLPSAISVTTLAGGFINTTTTTAPGSGGTYNVSAGDSVVLVNASSGVCTVKLPSPVLGREYTIKKIDSAAHTVTISTTSGTIDGSSTNTSLTAQWYYLTVTSDGTNWFIVGAGTT